MSLTDKQRRFVQEYLVDLNGTQAAIRAGYSKKTAAVIASENLRKPNIATALAAELAEQQERAQVNADMVVAGLLREATSEDNPGATKVQAWSWLGKHLAMFTDTLKHAGEVKGGVLAVPLPMTLEEWEARVKGEKEQAGD